MSGVVREEEDVSVKREEGVVKKRRRRTEEEVTVMVEEEERVPMMINNNPTLPTVVIKPRMMEKSTDRESDIVRSGMGKEADQQEEVTIRVADESEKIDKKTGGEGGEGTSLRVVQPLNTRLCGPRPARMALLCTVLVSVWITWIFLIHLSVKMSVISESLAELKGDLKGAEEHLLEDRLQGQQVLIRRLVEMARVAQGSATNKQELSSPTLSSTPSPSEGLQQQQLPSLCTRSGDPCILPFLYSGSWHQECVQESPLQVPWCASSVTSTGEMESWSYCWQCS